jgi:V/A-type H+-transporting ATPase subunit I
MKTVRILALRQDRKRLLEHLQDSALVQVKTSGKEAQEGFQRTDTSAQLKQFERNIELTEQALKILGRTVPEKKGMLASFRGRKEIDPDEIGRIAADSAKIIRICQKICKLDKQRTDYAAEQVRIKTSLAQLEPWKKLDIPLNTKDTSTTAVLIGTLPKAFDDKLLAESLAKECPELVFEFEILYTSPNMTCLTLFTPKRQREDAEKALRTIGFSQPLNPTSRTPMVKMQRQQQKSEDLLRKDEEARKDIEELAEYREAICETQDYFSLRSEKYKVIAELDQTKHVFVLNGYIPEEDCGRLEALCTKAAPSCVVEFEDAGEDAPIKLKNNKFAQPAQSIVTMYSTPAKEDIDPTPILAFFFYFFFGMMFSDAGYGLLMIIATAIAIKVFKPDKKMRNNLKLFQYCGVATVFWGLVFGSIFGDAPAMFYKMFTGNEITMKELLPWPTLDTQKDALMIMILSIALGLVHIMVGMGCKFYICLKHKEYAKAFFDTGLWMLLLIGVAVLAAGMAVSPVMITIGAAIAIASAVGLVLTQGREKKGIFGKLIGGVASLYDVTGYISDLLSYSRLLALGLTTGVMAQVFNMLSGLFGTSPVGLIFMMVIFVVGHAVTIGLNALGSYVHTMRLQYVEMFSKFYEGGGRPFEPFSTKSKYFKTKGSNEE